MNKYQYIVGGLLLLFIGMSGCSTEEKIPGEGTDGEAPIRLAGILSKTTGDCGDAGSNTYDNLFLSAMVDEAGALGVDFFKNKAFNNKLELPSYVEGNGTSKDISLKEPLYYPLGDKSLHLFAHSGELDNDGKMTLIAGPDKSNDYIISNGLDVPGMGTLSSSSDASTVLTFRHAMTKVLVDVVVDVDDTDTPDPIPSDIHITLEDGMAAGSAKYAVTSNSNTITGTGSYILQKGINYLIPNGSVLADKTNSITPITKLIIDDYEATPDDVKDLKLTPGKDNDPDKKVVLLSGYAYKITFNIKRLKVTNITFEMVDWDTVILGNENSSYVPAKLNVSLGSYLQTDKDAITKVVLHTDADGNKQYVGNVIYEGGNPVGQFVSLPSVVKTVDLYTSQGLLIAGVNPDAGSYQDDTSTPEASDKKIKVSLSKGGMRTLNTGDNSQSNPYLVETPLQFMNISKDEDQNVYFQQKNDIDFESLNTAFSPVGTFRGNYDGNGERILNATFTGNGLFVTNSGTINNIRIASGKITATGTHAGSICGVNNGRIAGCINEAQLYGSSATHAGGICGENNGTIIACLNTGDIFTGSQYSGGICGENKNTAAGAITACVNVGMMNRKSTNMAGICGTTASGTGLLKTCYWLTGTAKRYSGNDVNVNDTEEAAKGYTPAPNDDVADLSPQKLRDDHNSEEAVTTTSLLTVACQSSGYQFTNDVKVNGCVWPMPVKNNP